LSEVEVAFTYVNKAFKTNVVSFANNIFTEQGGTHVQGFERAILKVVNDYAVNTLKLEQQFIKEDILEGMNAVISFKTQEPKFSDQTKKKLSTGLGVKLVYATTKEKIESYFEENPEIAQMIILRISNAKKLREKIEKERNKARKEFTGGRFGGLPGKLADCQSKDASICELFLVEGDSAGGSAKQGRNRVFQAILPLKGKILNTSKSDDEKIENSDEVRALIQVLRTEIGENYNHSKLRYNKIIIMTDADVDGEHIAVLLLTFFMNKMPELIKQGHIYLAMPPLYVLKRKNGNYQYVLNDEQLAERFPEGLSKSGYELQRFKGLGEMNPDQLWETTMNPDARSLLKIDFKEEYKDDILKVFEDLMGKDVDRRRAFITENAQKANIDI
jgi:DNA gyrase subunit B